MKKILLSIILLQALWCSACKTIRKIDEQLSFQEKRTENIREEDNCSTVSVEEQFFVFHQEENERNQLERIAIFFDPSLPIDSFSRLPPVRAIEHSILIKENQKQSEKQATTTSATEEKQAQQKQTVIQMKKEEDRKRKEYSIFYNNWGIIGGIFMIGMLLALIYRITYRH